MEQLLRTAGLTFVVVVERLWRDCGCTSKFVESLFPGHSAGEEGRAGLSRAQCSGGGAVTRVASALILSMTTALRLPAFLCVAGEVHAQASMVAVH